MDCHNGAGSETSMCAKKYCKLDSEDLDVGILKGLYSYFRIQVLLHLEDLSKRAASVNCRIVALHINCHTRGGFGARIHSIKTTSIEM